MAIPRTLLLCFILYLTTFVICKKRLTLLRYVKDNENKSYTLGSDFRVSKIILPHNLRYLENMLNADVVAKAAKIRQRMEANPNNQDSGKGWPVLLAKYQADDKNTQNYYTGNSYGSIYNRRYPNF